MKLFFASKSITQHRGNLKCVLILLVQPNRNSIILWIAKFCSNSITFLPIENNLPLLENISYFSTDQKYLIETCVALFS